MKNLYQAGVAEEIKERIGALRPDSRAQWGKMNVAQMVAHCAGGVEMATGDMRPPRALLGRLMGWVIKPLVVGDDKPMRHNTPTIKGLAITDARNLEVERKRLLGLVGKFVGAGPEGCTRYPHSFFGRLTPEEWAIVMYKHLDHHLRQFGV